MPSPLRSKNNQRVFLSQLTSTTHHGFGIPEEETYVPLTDDKEWDDLSHYLNAVGYVDRWLSKILKILDSEGVADETLLILVGDHGLSIAERGYNHAVIAIPTLRTTTFRWLCRIQSYQKIDINDAVTSLQILPTILDLLIETKSLSESETQAARDLLRNYEGQSLLRPLRKFSRRFWPRRLAIYGHDPGGSSLAVRDARQPNWRLIVPVFGNYEWRFTDLATDPHGEMRHCPLTFDKLLQILERGHGVEAARWAEEAAVVTRCGQMRIQTLALCPIAASHTHGIGQVLDDCLLRRIRGLSAKRLALLLCNNMIDCTIHRDESFLS